MADFRFLIIFVLILGAALLGRPETILILGLAAAFFFDFWSLGLAVLPGLLFLKSEPQPEKALFLLFALILLVFLVRRFLPWRSAINYWLFVGSALLVWIAFSGESFLASGLIFDVLLAFLLYFLLSGKF